MDSLPQEIIQKIVDVLDLKSKQNLRQTNTSFFHIIAQTSFSLYFTRSKQVPKIVKVLSRHQNPLSITFTKTISLKPKAINSLSKLTNLTNINLEGHYDSDKIKKMVGLSVLTNLHSLEFTQFNPIADLSKIYQNLNQLTRLDARPFSPSELDLNAKSQLLELVIYSIPKIFLPQFSHISHLTSLVVRESGYLDNSNADVLKEAYNLKTLEITLGSWIKDEIWHAQPVPLTLRTLTALENLKVTHFIRSNEEIHHLTTLTKLDVSDQRSSPLTSTFTTLTNLNTLILTIYMGEGDETGADEYYYFLTALAKLTDLTIHDDRRDLSDFLTLAPTTITSLTINLSQTLVMGGISRLVNLQQLYLTATGNTPTVNYEHFTNLGNLTRLEVSEYVAYSSSVTSITRLTNLKVLKLANDCMDMDFALFKLPNLENLLMYSIDGKDVAKVTALTNLTQLVLKIEKMDLRFIQHLPLKVLSVRHYQGEGEELWQRLLNFTNLHSLTIALGSTTTVESQESRIVSLTSLHHLTHLHVLGCSSKLNLKLLSRLTNLQRMRLPIVANYEQVSKLYKLLPFCFSIEMG